MLSKVLAFATAVSLFLPQAQTAHVSSQVKSGLIGKALVVLSQQWRRFVEARGRGGEAHG